MDPYRGDVRTKKCKGRLKTDSTMTEVISSIQCEHSHEKDDKKLERQQIRALVKRKATDDLTIRFSKLIRTELQKFSGNELESTHVRSIAQSLYETVIIEVYDECFKNGFMDTHTLGFYGLFYLLQPKNKIFPA